MLHTWDEARRRVIAPVLAFPIGALWILWSVIIFPVLWPWYGARWAWKVAVRSMKTEAGHRRARSPSSLVELVGTGATSTYRSVTLKAKVEDVEGMECALFQLTQSIGHVLREEDVYFSVPVGQMKLRTNQRWSGRDDGQLISYRQTNNCGPNLSESRITHVQGVARLRHTLALSLDELGTINKRRRIYTKNHFRASLDEVEGLGCFVDIDIHSANVESIDEMVEQAQTIQKELGIADEQLVSFSYLDLINQRSAELKSLMDSGVEEGSEGSTC